MDKQILDEHNQIFLDDYNQIYQGLFLHPEAGRGSHLNESLNDIKDDLDELFEKYPPISSLSQVIPNSKWVKINYGSNSFYAVGIIYENNFVKYLVYAVPGKRELAPKGFESYSYFIPESIFDLSGNGFWCTFQSAEDGKRILKP